MADRTETDELNIFNEVQSIIDGLIKFDADSRMRIYRTVGTFFGFDDSASGAPQGTGSRIDPTKSPREPHFSTHEAPSPKDFVFQKRPATQIERVACLAYYLTHHRDTPHFKTMDISKLNTEAAQTKLSNASYAVNDATRSGLLATAAKGMKQLSAMGEKYVEALPDHAAAKALASTPKGRRSRRKSSRDGAGEAGGSRKETQ